MQGRFSICLSKACTRSRGRTGTGVNLLVFETSASTDSAIRADFVKIDCKCNHIFPFGKKSGQKNHGQTAYHIEYAHICVQCIPFPQHGKSYPANNRSGIRLRCCLPPQPTHKNTPANNRFGIPVRHRPPTWSLHKTHLQTTVSTSASTIVRNHSLHTKALSKHLVPLPHQP